VRRARRGRPGPPRPGTRAGGASVDVRVGHRRPPGRGASRLSMSTTSTSRAPEARIANARRTQGATAGSGTRSPETGSRDEPSAASRSPARSNVTSHDRFGCFDARRYPSGVRPRCTPRSCRTPSLRLRPVLPADVELGLVEGREHGEHEPPVRLTRGRCAPTPSGTAPSGPGAGAPSRRRPVRGASCGTRPARPSRPLQPPQDLVEPWPPANAEVLARAIDVAQPLDRLRVRDRAPLPIFSSWMSSVRASARSRPAYHDTRTQPKARDTRS
jgi:hypothetical protein